MQYRTLPGTGISVSILALGTMGFGTETDEAEAFAILDSFVAADGNLIDTANVYGAGASEELLGRWFASRPADVTDKVVLATKARFGTGPDVNEVGSSRRNLDRALTASLRRLGREKVDLYQLHGWDPPVGRRRAPRGDVRRRGPRRMGRRVRSLRSRGRPLRFRVVRGLARQV